jgi:hypothetical protein
MPLERIDQRVLGALRLVDRVIGTPVRRALSVHCDQARLVRNMSGLYVITEAEGLEAHSRSFTAPPDTPPYTPPYTPPLESLTYRFEIRDPKQDYLPRSAALSLPRDPDPANAGTEASLFTPVDLDVYPSSTAPLSANWSSIRASVTRESDPLRGALIRIVDPAEETLLASGITDLRGEALVIVPGVPVTKFAEDEGDVETDPEDEPNGESGPPVVVNTLPVRLEVSHSNATPWPVNPDLLEKDHAANRRKTMDLTLRTGRMERTVIKLT